MTELRHMPHTALGLRNLSLTIEARRFRHWDQAARDLVGFIAVMGIVIIGMPLLFGG